MFTYKTTKFNCRGSTLSNRVVGSHNDRSMPFAFKERRKVYLPGLGFPVSGSTLRGNTDKSKVIKERLICARYQKV